MRADARYIYIPAGGAKRVVLSTFLVFTFVALWHDLSFRLLAWGWLVTLFILPEIAARVLVPAKTVSVVKRGGCPKHEARRSSYANTSTAARGGTDMSPRWAASSTSCS